MMWLTKAIGKLKRLYNFRRWNLEPAKGYDLWAKTYDNEELNLMHIIDEKVLTELLREIDFENKKIIDFGCGTGRNWQRYLAKKPLQLVGIDTSAKMLNQLKLKIPEAELYHISLNENPEIKASNFDILISTLALEHFKNLELTFSLWSDYLKNEAEIIITDYHPDTLQKGGDISFRVNKKQYSIAKYIHTLHELEQIALNYNFKITEYKEVIIDHKLLPYYQKANAIHLYNKFEGSALYYAIHLKREI